MRLYPSIGVQVADILLPKPGTNLTQWASIACDQFTSQPEYWQKVAQIVGESPSTFKLTLPEVYLGTDEEPARVKSTQAAMQQYLAGGLLVDHEGLILVERTVDGKTRRGLMLALDLEQYDFNKGSQTLIRATEGTILDRLPPRMKIREGATLELPHILVLIDDPKRTVIEPLLAQKERLPKLYDFELMLDSGHLCGYSINDPALEKQVIHALESLADPASFASKYSVAPDKGVLLFAMGDGNHSLATAKAIWEKIKPQVGLNHPARYALVEIENVHDDGLEFAPIHRVLFHVKEDLATGLRHYFGDKASLIPNSTEEEMVAMVNAQTGPEQLIGLVSVGGYQVLSVKDPSSNLPVGTLQGFIDHWLKKGGAEKVDYVHGRDVVCKLGVQPGNLGFYLPGMPKSDLFKTVILDGALPRKTFSMGEAKEKRFYMEARKIVK
ncbi:hypothetical protein LARV_02164 [Longilinea arvoryzae]|uniref:DUF1015 domain-containing protein n=1 Tax=Longilinea arvoryzae TaxID=360412 RepID=A0A0S7BKC5_9CHLR|nr:DUF1015 domain-containing protein [Longilinea arvoryzae]GAP14395.1 hypothetical protein LARV_02164 [Longilinea arvoryzae]